VRKALQLSLNVPALAMLEQVGARRLVARLTQAGAALVLPEGEAPGLAVGLGGVGVNLTDLTMLYAGVARLGTVMPPQERMAGKKGEGTRLMEPVAAWYVGNVLLGTPPPENGVPGRIAFKTGTSYGYRDAWSIGFDGKRTIGVWLGRPDGAPVPGLVGRSAAAPILFDAFARLPTPAAPLPRPPEGVLVTTAVRLPPPLKHFQPRDGASETTQAKVHILFPPDGARLELRTADSKPEPIPLKVTAALAPLTVLVNGVPTPHQAGGTLFFQPAGPGFARVTVIDGAGAADSVMVRVEDSTMATATVATAPAACAVRPCAHP
jgi:penicillin-binding protein 1C